jgi:predicted peroxiredoxin
MLVHLATGPENPTRAALAMLVARTAASEGHEVTVFLAGDAVQFLRPETAAATHGVGLGSFEEHWSAIREAGVSIYASSMSSKARGIEPESFGAEPAKPQNLVELATAAETTLTY